MPVVLVVNSGSSSFKYQLIEMGPETVLASGLVERIGEGAGSTRHKADGGSWERELPIADHTAGFQAMLDAFAAHGPSLDEEPPVAVGHRVVHGGDVFVEPTVVTDRVKADIDDLSALAPLHNPGALQGIEAAQTAFPDVPHVAVFDTAFHQTLPAEAYTYAIDRELAAAHRIRRYGFHGTSHKYVSEAAARLLGKPLQETRIIVLHLGNGASAAAVQGGRSIDTSMGLTPLEGLVMGTRSGDIDPAILFHLARHTDLGLDELETLLNRRSGLLGLTGLGDMRDVQRAAADGDEAAQTALGVYRHRIRHYVGAYAAQLGGVDAVVFTAGVGENNPLVRRRSLAGLEFMGIAIDDDRNELISSEPRYVSPEGSTVAVLVIPTDEELEIARQSLAATAG